jgi:hypothetical protein
VNAIRDFAADNSIELVDLFPVFRTHSGRGPLYFRHDPHWTPAGHEVLAKGLEEHLTNGYFKSWCN